MSGADRLAQPNLLTSHRLQALHEEHGRAAARAGTVRQEPESEPAPLLGSSAGAPYGIRSAEFNPIETYVEGERSAAPNGV
jgi:hypothetical protein